MKLNALVALALAGCATPQVAEDSGDIGSEAAASGLPLELALRLEAGETVDVVVVMDDAAIRQELFRRRAAQDASEALLDWRAEANHRLGEQILQGLPARGWNLRRDYDQVPVLSLRLSSLEAGRALVAHPGVRLIEEDVGHEPTLEESLQLIGQPAAEAIGADGTGTAVAVLDTGADWRVADLGSCTAVGTPSTCRVPYAADFAPADGQLDVGGHGTNVSAIVAQVAPGADIIPLDVFRNDGMAYTSEILAAIDWAVTNKETYNIVAINMSLGGGSFTSECSSSGFSAGIQSARDAGILSVVASGNNGYTSSIAQPACVPEAFSVGAVYDSAQGSRGWSGCTDSTTAADKVTCFSNSASFLDILAPGALITAGGHTMGGTSQASPHVAGAAAVVAGAFPDLDPAGIEDRLLYSGPMVQDHRNGLSFPRLDLEAAVDGATVIERPSGTVEIGDAEYTNSRGVTLNLTASSTVTEMCISNTTRCTVWLPFESERSWALTTGNGTKTVYVQFRDESGRMSEQVSDTILVDAAPPRNSTLSSTRGDGVVHLSWTEAIDTGSGVVGYKVVHGVRSPATKCTNGTLAYEGSDLSASVTGLTNGQLEYFRVCAIDAAGNIGSGAVIRTMSAPESTGPTGTVIINDDDEWTNSTRVTLSMTASDASDVTAVCLSNSTSCRSWRTYSDTMTWSISRSSPATVYVYFRDQWGNVSASPATDSINVDVMPPTNGMVTATVGSSNVSLAWSGFSDSGTGMAGYKVAYRPGRLIGSRCSNGTLAYEGTGTSTMISGLESGRLYTARVCGVDVLGNVSTGSIVRFTAP